MDVRMENRLVSANLDVAAIAGPFASHAEEHIVNVYDGELNIDYGRLTGDPKVNAIEVLQETAFAIAVSPSVVQWPNTDVGEDGGNQPIILRNTSTAPINIQTMTFERFQGSGRDFTVMLNGLPYSGGEDNVVWTINEVLDPLEVLEIPVNFRPRDEEDNVIFLRFNGSFPEAGTFLAGVAGGDGHGGHPYLHVVIAADPFTIDYNGDGFSDVPVLGERSHTHEFGRALVGWEWRDHEGGLLSQEENTTLSLPVGDNKITLTIFDNNIPPQSLTGETIIKVIPATAIPGALAQVYDARETPPQFMLDGLPESPDFAQRTESFRLGGENGGIGNSTLVDNAVVQLLGDVFFADAGNFTIELQGGLASRLYIDGMELAGNTFTVTQAGSRHRFDARFAVTNLGEMPVQVQMAPQGTGVGGIPPEIVTHDESSIPPVINSMPEVGNPLGGERIEILGLGFFPEDSVSVSWGPQVIPLSQLTVTPEKIHFTAPPGSGLIQVTVRTSRGDSNLRFYEYLTDAAVPVNFGLVETLHGIPQATCLEWGPDGRLYVGTLTGMIRAIRFDDNYNVIETQDITALQSLWNHEILGIGFNPLEGPDPVRIYVSHSKLYANGGFCFSGFSPYSGAVSIISGPGFGSIQPLINNLPVSNHDHGVNGLQFDNKGDLYIAIGGNTNAGVPACNMGGVPESPLSAAVLKAEISKPGFNGAIRYLKSSDGSESNDQVVGGNVDVAPGVDVRVYASGLRNPFELVFTTKGHIYSMDNGANTGFGPASTGPTTSTEVGNVPDELNFIMDGFYYGHPNRNRGRHDGRQNIFVHPTSNTDPNFSVKAMHTYGYSSNGLTEYRANTFRGAMKGELVTQTWNGSTHRVKLSEDGRSTALFSSFPVALKCLTLRTGPGGVVIGASYSGNKLAMAVPNDQSVGGGMVAWDVFPWRASTNGGMPFVIGGMNFSGSTANTTVSFGGVAAIVTSVSNNRIRGFVPSRSAATAEPISVQVNSGGQTSIIPMAFQYLGELVPDTGARGYIEIDAGGTTADSSTYNANSFKIENRSTGGQKITKVSIDLRGSLTPDNVFDPLAQAGDPVGKPFTVDSNSTGGSINHDFGSPNGGGFDVLNIMFGNFNPGGKLGFSVDVDPTNIKGASPPGPNHAGSISGLEMSGAYVTFEFNDGSLFVTQPWRKPNSSIGSNNTGKPRTPQAPGIEVLGRGELQSFAEDVNQTIRVRGPVGSQVRLIHTEAALYLQGVPNGGFDVDPFEANTVIKVNAEVITTVGPGGHVDIPVTLTKTNSSAGYNYIRAVFQDEEGFFGPQSQVVVLQVP